MGRLSRCILRGGSGRDSIIIASHTNETGFALLEGLRPGDYSLTIGAVNYHDVRRPWRVAQRVDTVDAVLTRGLPICKWSAT